MSKNWIKTDEQRKRHKAGCARRYALYKATIPGYLANQSRLRLATIIVNGELPALRELQRKLQKRRYMRERDRLLRIDQTKRETLIAALGGRCVECGYNFDIRALALDHINSDGYIWTAKSVAQKFNDTTLITLMRRAPAFRCCVLTVTISRPSKSESTTARGGLARRIMGMADKKKSGWIPKSQFHPGGEKGKLHRELGVPEGEKIGASRLAMAARSDNPETARDAKRAETMAGWHHGSKVRDSYQHRRSRERRGEK